MYLVQREDTQVPLCNCEGESRMEGGPLVLTETPDSSVGRGKRGCDCVVRHPLRGSDGTNISAANLG